MSVLFRNYVKKRLKSDSKITQGFYEWKRRWLVLSPSHLEVYENNTEKELLKSIPCGDLLGMAPDGPLAFHLTFRDSKKDKKFKTYEIHESAAGSLSTLRRALEHVMFDKPNSHLAASPSVSPTVSPRDRPSRSAHSSHSRSPAASPGAPNNRSSPQRPPPPKLCSNHPILGCPNTAVADPQAKGMCGDCFSAWQEQLLIDAQQQNKRVQTPKSTTSTFSIASSLPPTPQHIRDAEHLPQLPIDMHNFLRNEDGVTEILGTEEARMFFAVMKRSSIALKRRASMKVSKEQLLRKNSMSFSLSASGVDSPVLGSGSTESEFSSISSAGIPASLTREDQILLGKKRLTERLTRLGLKEVEMEDDGNCQFRAFSHQLFRTQNYHNTIRQCAVYRLTTHPFAFLPYFDGEEEYDNFCVEVSLPGTWGDEVTLKAICDLFKVDIYVVLSTEKNWLLKYEPTVKKSEDQVPLQNVPLPCNTLPNTCTPQGKRRTLFLSYISPVHYNSIVLNTERK